MTKKTKPDLLTVSEAAEFLQISRSAVWDAIAQDRIVVAQRYGRLALISRPVLAAYKKKRRRGGPPSKNKRFPR